MLAPVKLLKIALPVATVTSATIATVSLVSSRKEDAKLDSSLEDKVLEDFEKPTEKFEEQIMLYAKDGKGEGFKVSSEEEKQQLLERLKKEGLQDDGNPQGNSNSDPSALAQQPQEKTDQLTRSEGDAETDNSISLELQKPKDNPDLSSESKNVIQKGDGSDDKDQAEEDLSGTGETKNQDGEGDSGLDDNKAVSESGDETVDSPEVKGADTHQSTDGEISEDSKGNLDDGQEDLIKKQDTIGGEENDGQDTIDLPGNKTEPASEDPMDSGKSKNTEGPESLDEKGSQTPLGSQDERDQISSIGADDSVSSSSGRSDGIDGENGQEPISPEQLRRFEEIGKEASTVLDSLKGLLGDNFQI